MTELSDDRLAAEIDDDRRAERRVAWQAVVALVAVGLFVAVRVILVGGPG
jgi:hypothetical protein